MHLVSDGLTCILCEITYTMCKFDAEKFLFKTLQVCYRFKEERSFEFQLVDF